MDSDINKLVWPQDGRKFQWIDRLDTLLSAATKLGVAYAGVNALKHPMGAVVGLVALKLATSPSIAAGAVGAATLAGIGLLNFVPAPEGDGAVTHQNPLPQVIDPTKKYPFESWLTFFYQEGKVIEPESWPRPYVDIPPGAGIPPEHITQKYD